MRLAKASAMIVFMENLLASLSYQRPLLAPVQAFLA
jgi:hypothetical protein